MGLVSISSVDSCNATNFNAAPIFFDWVVRMKPFGGIKQNSPIVGLMKAQLIIFAQQSAVSSCFITRTGV